MLHQYTTGWTKVHGIPWFNQNTRVQFDIELDDNKAYLVGIREWDLTNDEVTHTDNIEGFRIYSDLTLGEGSVCSRPLPGEAGWTQTNADWQPVNQRIADELYKFVCK